MITEKSIISKIEILEDGQIQVQRANLVLRDGTVIAKEYHRQVLAPGDSLASQDANVAAHARLAWTPAVVAAYKTLKGQAVPL